MKMLSFDEWKEKARKDQQSFASILGDRMWDKFAMPEEDKQLWLKIAIALAGPPRSEDESNAYGYTTDEQEKIADIKKKCILYCKNQGWADVYVAVFYVMIWKKGSDTATLPVIRVKYKDGKDTSLSEFLDHTGRHYTKWSDFLKDNVFAGYWICLPKDGRYILSSNEQVQLQFQDQTRRDETIRNFDEFFSIVNFTTSLTTAIGIAMAQNSSSSELGEALVISSSIVGISGASYGAARSMVNITDRVLHEQTINPFTSSEARASWLTTTASLLSFGTMASNCFLVNSAEEGDMAKRDTRVFCTALNVTSLSTNGLGVVNAVFAIAKKEKVTSLDILQLSTSVFYFTHSLVKFETASTIIKEAQRRVIDVERQYLQREQQLVYDSWQNARQDMFEPGKTRAMHGDNEFIKDLKKIENKQDYFKAFNIVEGNQLSVHNELVIHPKAFLQMTDEERTIVIDNCEKLTNKTITYENFWENVSRIRKEYRIEFEQTRTEAIEKLKSKFDLDNREVGKKKIFQNLKPHEIDRLHSVMMGAGESYNESYIEVGHKIADLAGCKDVAEYTAAFEFGISKIHEHARNEKKGTPKKEAKKKAVQSILNEEHTQQSILNEFKALVAECDKLNVGQPNFCNSMAAANHYYKHNIFPKIDPSKNPITAEKYFTIAREITSGQMENPKWTQDGSSLMCQFTSDKYGAMAVRYDNLPNGTSVIATLMNQTTKKPIGAPQLHRLQ